MARLNIIIALVVTAAVAVLSSGIAGADGSAFSSRYTRKITALSARSGGAGIGRLMPATTVTVLDTKNGQARVRIQSWTIKGHDGIVFEEPGKRIIKARLGDNVQRKVVETTLDDYGKTWRKISFSGWVAKDDLSGDLDTVWNNASSRYRQSCRGCHLLYEPSRYRANQWPSVMKRMAGRAGLDRQQTELITQYLQYHARDMDHGD